MSVKDEPAPPFEARARQGRWKWLIILAGILTGQVVLYGPSLAGRKILLPLDYLSAPGVCLPATNGPARVTPSDTELSDLILSLEPARRFVVAELHAGRFPMWTPRQYAGAPFVWPKYSPILLLGCITESPVVLAWVQLVAALVAGIGAYQFCRRVLAVGFWPAAVAAWCYPLTGLFILWQGYSTCTSVFWLPWLLLAVHRAAAAPSFAAVAGLSVATWLALVSGHLDVAGQVLLTSGFFALWCLWNVYREKWFQRPALKAAAALTTGWALGFLLAAPHVLPLLEYTHATARMARRSAGEEERPPFGLRALPQVVLPYMYGSAQRGSVRLPGPGQTNLLESSAAAYTGVVATLLVAPLAWCSRRHRALNAFWLLLAFFALSWCLDVPGCVDILRLPGLNLMSHNRFVFAASFAILALAATGMEVLLAGPLLWRRWFWLPAAVLAALCAWCVYRSAALPEPVATQIEAAVRRGARAQGIADLNDVRAIQSWFSRHYAAAGVWCGVGLAGWLGLRWRSGRQPRLFPALAVLLVGDLLWFGYGRNPQCDPALYYPRIPVLENLAKATSDRIIGFRCLPAMLGEVYGLHDIRGYDGADPGRLMELMNIAAAPAYKPLPYALTQWFLPKATLSPQGDVELSPVLDLLGVRYVIFRGSPHEGARPVFAGQDYWVLANPAALPRAFVPRRVETITDRDERLYKLGNSQFDPREVAYVESPVNLPAECRGSAQIAREIPTRVTVSVRMETPGLVVLADLWDPGWRAYLDGQPVPILRANHALRGVVVPAGTATLEFRYEPASFTCGLWLAGLAAAVLLAGLAIAALRRRLAHGSSVG